MLLHTWAQPLRSAPPRRAAAVHRVSPRRSGIHRSLQRLALALPLALLLLLGTALAWAGGAPSPRQPSPLSSYVLAQRAPFNRPEHYPLERVPDPALYRPHAAWMGRLILPSPAEIAAAPPDDWVWLEIAQAPAGESLRAGQRVQLRWADDPSLRALVQAVTTEVHLGEPADALERQGNVVPRRLDGRRVGPLQSLAGARPHDDVTVALEEVSRETLPGGGAGLRIGRPPLQITGRWEGLVQLLGPVAPGSDRFRVRHWSRARSSFSGPEEVIRLPQQPPDRFGRQLSSSRGLLESPLGRQGWYIQGAPDAAGLFTVQALRPRALLQLSPDEAITGQRPGLGYISGRNWQHTPQRRGTLQRVRLGDAAAWPVGRRALLLHNFGGIGGPGGEPSAGFTVTGHFAFGEARVVNDPFTGEPRFDLRYHQIYANNPNGIVSGSHDWSAYAGDLQRGWLGTRPFSDVVIHLEALDDPPAGPGRLSPLRELATQAEVLSARYRSGDGTGIATVTPSTSCVQDSAQALFIAIEQLQRQGGGSASLAELSRSLRSLLSPFGRMRPDWQHNAATLAAVAAPEAPPPAASPFLRGQSWRDALLSWRSMLPRRAHDEIAATFLRHGADLWFLRTNQVPGADPTLLPLAPTLLLGQLPPLALLLRRCGDALVTPLNGSGMALSLALLGVYAALVVPAGLRSGFLAIRPRPPAPGPLLWRAAGLLVMPALLEELLFRIALLPHPLEGASPANLLAWAALSLGLFVLYHPLAAAWWYPAGRGIFGDPRFLVACTLLGLLCTAAYLATGSLWPPVLLHWVVVLVWLEALGTRTPVRHA